MVSNNNLKPTLDKVLPVVEKLPIEEKAKLVQRLVGEQSGLNVVFSNRLLLGSVIMLINMMSRDELSKILEAIANRFTAEGS